MSLFIAICGSILAFFIVVVVHEYGHFLVARWVGVKVLRFSIGFGKPIYTHQAKSGVEYAIGFLPLGGYVKMQDAWTSADETRGSKGDAFENKSVWCRIAIVIAGPLANIILAAFLFSIIYTIGITHVKPIIGRVIPHSMAASAHLKPQDRIIQIGAWQTPDWQRVMMMLILHMGNKNPIPMVIESSHGQRSTHLLNLQQQQFDPAKTDLLRNVGIKPYFPVILPIISKVMPDSPASHSGLRPHDHILAVNQIRMQSWQQWMQWIERHPTSKAHIKIERGHHIKTLLIEVGQQTRDGKTVGFLGIEPQLPAVAQAMMINEQYPWWKSMVPAIKETQLWVIFHFVTLKQIVMGNISLKALGGPVSIFETAGVASLAGMTAYLAFMAFISVALGVLNILPIPALDGGHLLFCIIELILGRPVSIRTQVLLTNVGVIFLVVLMVFATTNDVTRLLR